jgi:hypothetical protein
VSFADANRSSIRIIEETVWGTTPAAGSSREVRLTSSSMSAQKETIVSDELRADRMVGSITEVSAMSSGDINFEYSAGSTDELLAAFVMGAWSRPMTQDFWRGTKLSVSSATTFTWAGADITKYLATGRRIKVDGFENPKNNGYFSISSLAFTNGSTIITIASSGLVPANGTFDSRLMDANDVIVLNNTDIAGTVTGFAATGAFASAIAAGQLVPGQRIAVTGLGLETGSIAITAALGNYAVTISDGVNAKKFTSGIDYTGSGTAAAAATGLAAAINKARVNDGLRMKAEAASGTVTITNLNAAGGSITTNVADPGAAVTAFAGGNKAATGYFTILSLTADEIVTLPAPGVTPKAKVQIKGSMLRNPSDFAEIAQRSFSIETGYNDVGQFMIQDGMVPGTFSLDISTGSIITGTIGFEGRSTDLKQTTVLGNKAKYAVLEAPAGEVVNATTDVGDITKDGTNFEACIQSLSISGEANLRQQACIGSKFSSGIGAGRFNLSGSMSIFFQDERLFRDFLDHETVSLSFSITDHAGCAYYYTIPATKFSSDEIAPGGIDQDVIENMEWVAFRDPATGCMLQVDRFSPLAEV